MRCWRRPQCELEIRTLIDEKAADAVRRLVKDWKADAIICVGDLFAGNNILRVRTRGELISVRLPMHFPVIGRS